jgi:Mg2+-importing ATPase
MLPEKTLSYFATNSVEHVLKTLNSSEKGLSRKEALKRLEKYGFNIFDERKKKHVVLQFLSNFTNPLVLILVFISIFSLITGEPFDAGIVFAMVLMSVVLNFIQEYKAGRAAEKLKEKISHTSSVVRDGVAKEVSVKDICVGDVIELNAGDIIPADCRIIQCKDLYTNQSSLTGESFPAEKIFDALSASTETLTEMKNMLFQGTNVVTGSALAVVVKTANSTEFGKIAKDLVKQEQPDEFTKGVTNFSLFILRVIILFVLFILIVNSILKQDFFESLLFSIAVAVGLTPEFLPMIMSVTMAKGSINMAKRGVLVKKLAAIPSFGSMDVLCTDKTGTLTEDKIQLVKYIDVNGEHSDKVLLNAYLNSFFQTGINNPLDEAVLTYKKLNIESYKKIDEIPFDFQRRRLSIVTEDKNGVTTLIAKGAPEEIFACCTSYKNGDETVVVNSGLADKLMSQYIALSNEGYRVLAVASKEIPNKTRIFTKNDECDLELLGYIAFLDPPKKDAGRVLRELEEMGIEVKILTGDNELVSKKICAEVGLHVKGVLTSHEMHLMTEEELAHKVNNITIFARFSPDDKNKIIRALRSNKHVVGYMGDGINDAPSLHSADVGISVSNAVDVAKESADILLTNKSLHQLKDGVIEGRKTFGNTMKYIMMGVSSNFGNMFSVLVAVVFLPFLPMLPIQILLNNFLYDLSQLTIPTDNVDNDFIRKPKRWSMEFIKKFMITFGSISSLFDCISFISLYLIFGNSPSSFQTGWFMESLATQTLVIHIIRTRKIPFIQSGPSRPLLLSTILVVILGWLIPFSPLSRFFGFQALQIPVVLLMAVIVTLYLTSVELMKRLFFKKYFNLV